MFSTIPMSSASTSSTAWRVPRFQSSPRRTKRPFRGNCSSRLTSSFDDLHYLEFRLRGADLQLRGGVPITSQPAQVGDWHKTSTMLFPVRLLAKCVAVPPHALRQGETHVVLIALGYFFARCKTRYQRAPSRQLWERFYLPV